MKISPPLHKLGDLQLRILQLLWQHGEMPAAGVHAALQPERSLAPTTIATMLAKMEARGLLTHREQGRAFIYRAALSSPQSSPKPTIFTVRGARPSRSMPLVFAGAFLGCL
jgi:predicted transcriptional regulator